MIIYLCLNIAFVKHFKLISLNLFGAFRGSQKMIDNKSKSQPQRASLRQNGLKRTYLPVLGANKGQRFFFFLGIPPSTEHQCFSFFVPFGPWALFSVCLIFNGDAIQISLTRRDLSVWAPKRTYVSLSTRISLQLQRISQLSSIHKLRNFNKTVSQRDILEIGKRNYVAATLW